MEGDHKFIIYHKISTLGVRLIFALFCQALQLCFLALLLTGEGVDTIDIAGEERGFLDVSNSAEFGGEALESHADAAVGWNTVFDGLEVELKLIGIKSYAVNTFYQIFILVDSLSAEHISSPRNKRSKLRVNSGQAGSTWV